MIMGMWMGSCGRCTGMVLNGALHPISPGDGVSKKLGRPIGCVMIGRICGTMLHSMLPAYSLLV